MIRVYWSGSTWAWVCGGIGNAGYDTADHALRDAWTWTSGSMPALIQLRGAE